MDVTRENFAELLPLIYKAIDEALFISIDGEFSGINNGSYNTAVFDSLEERYQKLSCNVIDFLLMQFGLSAFIWDEESHKYRVEVFNFYIFPLHTPGIGSPDRVFSCQSSSIDFLIRHGFDFNMVFKQGIPFLRQNEEANMKIMLQEKQAHRDSFKTPSKDHNNSRSHSPGFRSPSFDSPTVNMDQKTKDFVDKICAAVEEFLKSEEKMELALEPCNSYLRKVLYETLPKRFPNHQLLLESRTDDKSHLRYLALLRGAGEEVRKEREAKKKQQEEENFQNAVGFSKVIKHITEAKKLVIGHNMLLDVMFTIKQFVSVLPSTLDEFKTLSQCVFPQVLDTKLMASLLPFKDFVLSTTLGDLHSRLKSPPFNQLSVCVPEKYDVEKDPQNAKLHEAAYDSYITGCCFSTMLDFLCTMQNKNSSEAPSLSLIEPFVNKVFLMKTIDLPYLNLAGADLSPNRDHVFFVTFPRSWKSSDLRQLFSPFGQVMLSWVNDTSCFVSLNDKTQLENVKKTLTHAKGAEALPYQLMTYSEYQEQLSSFKAKNLLWLRDKASITPLEEESPAKSSLTSENATDSTNRKRRPDNGGQSPELSATEPVNKKHRSENDDEKTPADNTSSTHESGVFEVPDTW